jgi:multiple antibiotic resistance protein
MDTALQFFILAVTSIIAIMNPISTAAVFSILTEKLSQEQQRVVILDSLRISLVVLIFFALTGQVIFTVLGLTIPAFKIAGGILLVSFAFGMFAAKKEVYSPEELENIAVVPLAFPLTCGAGTITVVILIASQATGFIENVLVIVAVMVAILSSYFAMRYSGRIIRFIGEHELRIITKFLAIFVLAIAVQFIIDGLADAMPFILSQVHLCSCPS